MAGTKCCKTWTLPSKGSKTSREEELLVVQPRQHMLSPVSSTNHSAVERAGTEAGGLEGLSGREESLTVSPTGGQPTQTSGWDRNLVRGLSDERLGAGAGRKA